MMDDRTLGGFDGRRGIPPPNPPPDDSTDRLGALREEQGLERAASEHKQDEAARRIIAWGMRTLMFVVFLIIISAVVTLGYHLLAPGRYHWLSPEEIETVRNAVVSGSFVALGTTYLRRYIN